MYMCDKPLPQQKLADQLTQPLLEILENPKLKSKTARIRAALSYLSVFWSTIVREWPGIDKHRYAGTRKPSPPADSLLVGSTSTSR